MPGVNSKNEHPPFEAQHIPTGEVKVVKGNFVWNDKYHVDRCLDLQDVGWRRCDGVIPLNPSIMDDVSIQKEEEMITRDLAFITKEHQDKLNKLDRKEKARAYRLLIRGYKDYMLVVRCFHTPLKCDIKNNWIYGTPVIMKHLRVEQRAIDVNEIYKDIEQSPQRETSKSKALALAEKFEEEPGTSKSFLVEVGKSHLDFAPKGAQKRELSLSPVKKAVRPTTLSLNLESEKVESEASSLSDDEVLATSDLLEKAADKLKVTEEVGEVGSSQGKNDADDFMYFITNGENVTSSQEDDRTITFTPVNEMKHNVRFDAKKLKMEEKFVVPETESLEIAFKKYNAGHDMTNVETVKVGHTAWKDRFAYIILYKRANKFTGHAVPISIQEFPRVMREMCRSYFRAVAAIDKEQYEDAMKKVEKLFKEGKEEEAAETESKAQELQFQRSEEVVEKLAVVNKTRL